MRPIRNITLVLLGAIALLTLAALPLLMDASPPGPTPQELFARLDDQNPGRGSEPPSTELVDFAMSYGLFASSAALAGDEIRARLGADRLLLMADALGKPGWPLPNAWDAFQDGTVNPMNTAYGINTAIGVRALIDAWNLTRDEKYQQGAVAALDYYADFVTETDSGSYFWYSDQPVDAIPVINVTSALMGQYARAARLWGREDYKHLADEAFAHVWSHRRVAWNGINWLYSGLPSSRVNDSVHAAITVQGLIEYREASDRQIDLEPAFSYLTTFIEPGASTDFPRSAEIPFGLTAKPAQLWGLGMLVFTLASAERYADANLAASEIERYRSPTGDLLTTPNGRPDNRQFMHALLGLSRLHNR